MHDEIVRLRVISRTIKQGKVSRRSLYYKTKQHSIGKFITATKIKFIGTIDIYGSTFRRREEEGILIFDAFDETEEYRGADTESWSIHVPCSELFRYIENNESSTILSEG